MAEIFSLHNKRIWVAGHTGLVGSTVIHALEKESCTIMTVTRQELDLCLQKETGEWIKENKPDVIVLAAAKVGGIGANAAFPAEFLYDNLAIAQNVIHAAYLNKVEKLIYLGSSCIYPKFAAQPIEENALLSGVLEPTNEAYAIAKIAGLKLCQFYRRQYGCDFISLMPCNLYGPGDHWDKEGAHVIPSLIGKFHRAKIENLPSVEIWGSGTPLREFLYSEDLARGVLHALKYYSGEIHLNIGSGTEISIGDLAKTIQKIIGYKGDLVFDASKPDGTPRKLLDSHKISNLGWTPEIDLEKGLQAAYEDFLSALNRV